MMHDFSITENYTIFMVLPIIFDLKRLTELKTILYYDKDEKSKFVIIPRHWDGDMKKTIWFESSNCYVYHTGNSYEENDEVVLQGCRLLDATNLFPSDSLRVTTEEFITKNEEATTFYEWRFNLKNGTVKEKILNK
jgi:carotenoid cleavage dioxygenase-like enzyme